MIRTTWWDDCLDGALWALWILIGLTLGMACAGCSEPRPTPREVAASSPITVWIDVPHPGARQAVDAWAYTTRGVRDWQVVRHPDEAVIRMHVVDMSSEHCRYPGMLACVSVIGGAWKGEPVEAWFVDGQYQGAMPLVAMHEIGHALGLTHQDFTMMQGRVGGAWAARDWRCPDPVSVARLESELGVEGMRACELPE